MNDSFKITQVYIEQLLEKMHMDETDRIGNDLTGIKTWLGYGFLISFLIGAIMSIGATYGRAFSLCGMFVFFPNLVGLLLVYTRRPQIAVIGHLATWFGSWYGFSIGAGMVASFVWTPYVYVPTGAIFWCIYHVRFSKKMERGHTYQRRQ